MPVGEPIDLLGLCREGSGVKRPAGSKVKLVVSKGTSPP
jgi:hypothetical protein